MSSNCSIHSAIPSYRIYRVLPLVSWLSGVLFGIYFAYTNQALFFPLMRSTVSQPVSIVGFLVSIFLPLTLSVLLYSPFLFLLICFLKAASYGFTLVLTYLFFRDAVWLFGSMFLFSDGLCLVVLLGLWIQSFEAKIPRYVDRCISAVICIAIVGIDYLFISPFLRGLL